MVKVINPLFSTEARGRFGGVQYQTGSYGQIARVYVPQRKKPTAAQLEQNYRFGRAADSWRLLEEPEKEDFRKRATNLQMTGFNLWVKEYFEGEGWL